MAHSSPSNDRTTCPCKKLPMCLSSFTAAEYGDLHSLQQRVAGAKGNNNNNNNSLANLCDAAGNGPLHIAAQNGHVTTTQYLLTQLKCPVNGNYDVSSSSSSAKIATPLHRASYSGAVATMQLLLQQPDCLLLVPDTSFGDYMTPLHKAAAGGRYLAVQLLLQTLQQQQHQQQNLLKQALQVKDKFNRTPLQVAMELQKIQKQEQQSVARWDQVAGGKANWNKCVQLLQQAQQQQQQQQQIGNDNNNQQTMPIENDNTPIGATTTVTVTTNTQNTMLPPPPPPQPTTTTNNNNNDFSCLDCSDGVCVTATWEKAFQTALFGSVQTSLTKINSGNNNQNISVTTIEANNKTTTTRNDDNTNIIKPATISSNEAPMSDICNSTQQQGTTTKNNVNQPKLVSLSPSIIIGRCCANCQKQVVALYPIDNGLLVCKKCKRSKLGVYKTF